MNAYLILLVAIAAEVAGSIAIRLSMGFTKFVPSVIVFVGYGVALVLLSIATKSIPLSISYTMWAGLGTAGAVVASIFLFKEPLNWLQFAGIGLIVIGVLVINFFKVSSAA